MAEWHIPTMKPNKPHEHNPTPLVHCKIIETTNNSGYAFVGPRGDIHSISLGVPQGPFEFPVFDARLSGPRPEPWYITVEFLEVGGLGRGKSSNSGFRHGDGADEPDTWVAHAGATVEEGEGKDTAAASASST